MTNKADVASNDYVRGMERLMDAVQELSLARELEQVQHIVRSTARELVGSDGAAIEPFAQILTVDVLHHDECSVVTVDDIE